MRVISKKSGILFLLALSTASASGIVSAQEQEQDTSRANITVNGALPQEAAPVLTVGPEIKGVITARKGNKLKVTSADGTSTIIAVNEATKVKSGGGVFGGNRNKLSAASLLNGMPVTVKTMQGGDVLVASQVTFKSNDLKTATMIRNGTSQQFDEQTAATEALRGRMADIDQYNVKSATNVYFDTGRAALSPDAKTNLCSAATEAEGVNNALLLVVGYTDSVGSEEYNQTLSEKRAASVINYLQQVCRWKPYRMLTPTGMAESDPLASNDTAEGKAQNRRVSVNILVSKAADGL